jgi:type III pantothenate kinase
MSGKIKLLIDYGNSLVKVAFFRDDKMVELHSFDRLISSVLRKLVNNFRASHGIPGQKAHALLSGVREVPPEIITYLTDEFEYLRLDHKTALPVIVKYKTPETLGQDRIALAVAASGLYPAENILVIDAGTCITFDFVNKNKEYLGGGISPGILMRFRALHEFTGKLPLITQFENSGLIGNTTADSIISGVLNGAVAEVDTLIDRYRNEFAVEKILLTGGDMIYFDKRLKNNIFAHSNLVLTGLNLILNYNVGK